MNPNPALLNAERFRREVATELGRMNAEDAQRLCNILSCVLACLQELDGRLTALEALARGGGGDDGDGHERDAAAVAVVNGHEGEREKSPRVSPGPLPMRTRLSAPSAGKAVGEEPGGGGGQDWVPMACV